MRITKTLLYKYIYTAAVNYISAAENIVSKSCAKNSHDVCPLMSANVRQCPKKHVRCPIESKKDST